MIHINFKKRELLNAFCDRPREFIEHYIQATCGNEITSDGGHIEESTRRSEFYRQSWITDAVFQYLNSRMYGNEDSI